MFKKIMLAVTTFALVAVAYQVYQWQDDTVPVRRKQTVPPPPPRPPGLDGANENTTGVGGEASPTVTIAGAHGQAQIASGEAPFFRMYDRKGNAKIVFRATRWNPVSDNEFEMVGPMVRLLLPGGQLAYVRADEGQVTVQQGDGSKLDPKRGWLRGNVFLAIDLTKPEWRKANPELADPEEHPESVVKIWLDEVEYDLDLTRLESKGPIRLESIHGTLEGRGLELVWDEVGRRIRSLIIAEGKRATLEGVELASLGIGGEKAADEDDGQDESESSRSIIPPPPSRVEESETPDEEESEESRLTFVKPGEETQASREKRVDSYRVAFAGGIVVRQQDGNRTDGFLKADQLELLMDLGKEDRKALEQSPATRPSEPDAEAQAAATQPAEPPSRSRVALEWSGRLEVMPAAEEEAVMSDDAKRRLHLLAKGSPVEISSGEAGSARCLELEYHDETGKIWLRGSPQQLVEMESGPSQQIMGETIVVDKSARIARIEGAGKLIDRKSSWDDSMSSVLSEPAADSGTDASPETVEIRWSKQVELEFAVAKTGTQGVGNGSPIAPGTYPKTAVFEGDVTFLTGEWSITADRVDAFFREPSAEAAGDRVTDMMVADRVVAAGHVQMFRASSQAVERVNCDRLEVTLTVDSTGRSVPTQARASGHVEAKQLAAVPPVGEGSPERLLREIRAGDSLVIDLVSVPKPVLAEEESRFREKAAELGIEPGSEKWDRYEQQLRNRREIVTDRMRAYGDVVVVDRKDPEEGFDLAANSLDCVFGRGEGSRGLPEIKRALITGDAERAARVALGDFFVSGPQISVDLMTKSATVPGAGLLRFLADKDLDGRSVDQPIPVNVTWDDHMRLQGDRDTGQFVGAVRIESDSMAIKCQELQLQFRDQLAPAQAATQPAAQDPLWIIGPVVEALRGEKEESGEERLGRALQKELIHVRAIGKVGEVASIEASVYQALSEGDTGGPVKKLLTKVLPQGPDTPASQLPADQRRLINRVLVTGPRIAIDLLNEHFVVEGAGNMGIENYQLPKRGRSPAPTDSSDVLGGASLASFKEAGPSQTAFAWSNRMSFLNQRNVAVFDGDAVMVYRSGARIESLNWFASQMKIDAETIRTVRGRTASLTCDRFVVEFKRDEAGSEGSAPLSRATRLKNFWAGGRVRLEEGDRFLVGTEVNYDTDTQMGHVSGSPRYPAKLAERDRKKGSYRVMSVESFEWDQKTGLIKAKDPIALGN